MLIQPDSVLIDQFTSQLDRAVRKAFHATGNSLVAKPIQDLVTVPINTRPAATYTFPIGPQPVLIPADASKVTFTINIALADKLAALGSKSFAWGFSTSNDNGQTWQFLAGGTWISYGPDGFFSAYLNEWNPDPRLILDVTQRRGQPLRGELILNQSLEAGVTITTE